MVKRTIVCVADDHSDGGVAATIVGCAGDAYVGVVPERYGQILS